MEKINSIKLPDGITYAIEDANALTKQQITNCVLEIPQDIKLELSNGTLTLKAGSKVYVPNGFEADGTTPKFDEVVIESDVAYPTPSGLGISSRLLMYNVWNNSLSVHEPSLAVSNSQGKQIWWDVVNNRLYCSGGGGVASETNKAAFPLGIVSNSEVGKINTIDQTFNGFGYIGSTVYVTKGVKGLIPDGRNEDGTLNNIEFTTDRVLVHTVDVTDVKRVSLIVSLNNTLANFFSLINSETQPSQTYRLYYKASTNELRVVTGTSTNIKITGFVIGDVITQIGSINSFIPKLPFRAIDYSDKSIVSSWGMPTNKYINLTLGASGTVYTAPANGWFNGRFSYTAGGYYHVQTGPLILVEQMEQGTNQRTFLVPIKKGAQFNFIYSNLQTADYTFFRFIYADGEV